MTVIAAYVSGHGFGHAVRTGEVLRAVRRLRPDVKLVVTTSAPGEVVRRVAGEPIEYRRLQVDVGLVQRSALEIDEGATAAACRAFQAVGRERIDSEAEWLAQSGVRVVIADIPPLAFEAADKAGVPAIGMTNFSWDWIYRHLARRQPALVEAADQAARAYARAHLLLELPFAGDLSAFPRRERIPLVARRPQRVREEARRRLGLAGEPRPIVLLSFGGIGLPGLDLPALDRLGRFLFLTTEGAGEPPPNVRRIDLDALLGSGLDYLDLVGAADAVVSKPGYGIVTDAIGAGTRLVYTERGDFPEYAVFVREMPQWLACAHVSNADLSAGRLEGPLLEVLARPIPPGPPLNGADVAADRLLRAL